MKRRKSFLQPISVQTFRDVALEKSVKSHTDFSNAISDMSDQQILYKNNGHGKATIDCNFFKSMAQTIKADRPIISAKTRYVDPSWIEGHAMRAHPSQVPLAT